VESSLGEPFLSAFRQFCHVWSARFDWADPSPLRLYLALGRKERRDLYHRFARECRMWESTLRLAARGEPLPELPSRLAERRRERKGWRRRLEEIEEREERSRSFHERLASQAMGVSRTVSLPWAVREAFRLLGLPADSSLAEVRRSYRRLALSHHPDHQGDHVRMSDLNRAYRNLVEHFRNP